MFLDIIHLLVFCLNCRPVYISKHNVSEKVLPDDRERIQSPKRCILKYIQDDILDKRRDDG
jgi:hypothetical protein